MSNAKTDDRGRGVRRREFLRSVMRVAVLGAVGLLTGRLASSATCGGPTHPEEKCGNRGICRGCRRRADCASPQAEMFRQAHGRS